MTAALTYSAAVITFFSVVGPPKVLLAFGGLAQNHPVRELRMIALVSSGAAVLVGLIAGFTAPWLLDLFHISTPALQLAGGVIFFIYAVGLVLGVHLGSDRADVDAPDLVSGVRELLMPYIVSPLAMTAVLIEAAARDTWSWRSTVVGAYVTVIALDLVCVVLLARILRGTLPQALKEQGGPPSRRSSCSAACSACCSRRSAWTSSSTGSRRWECRDWRTAPERSQYTVSTPSVRLQCNRQCAACG